ncbi:MAG: hypothetical protein GY711_06920 [bacterium]|nr:hypothetical protein [bacterium]
MGLRWTFDGPDRYHEAPLEATGPDGLEPLNELDYVRSKTLTTLAPPTDVTSEHLQVLERLVGPTWEAKGGWPTGGVFHIQSTFEWVPYADYVHARCVALVADGEPTHLLDAYVYDHTESDALRCLALSRSGGVCEGELKVLEDGALQLDLMSYEGHEVVPYVVRFDFETDGILRDRVWAAESTERTLILDVHHTKLEPKKD